MRFFLLLFFIGGLSASSDFNRYYCEDIKKPFFKIEEVNGEKRVRPNREGSHYFDFPFNKDKKRRRIFIVGESAAAILYSNNNKPKDQPFFETKDFEIINFGMPAYESKRIKDVVIQSLDFNPDAIVLMSGNNEGFNEPCPGLAFEIKRRYLNVSYNLAKIFSNEREKLFNLSLKIQKDNISETIDRAYEKNIKIFIVTLPYNVFLPPDGERPADKEYISGYMAYDDGKYDLSQKIFEKIVLKDKKKEPFARYYLGMSLYKRGEQEKAYDYLSQSLIFDNRLDRAGTQRNDMLRKLAAEKKADLIDLEKKFLSVSKNNLFMDENLFADGVHWYRDNNPPIQNYFIDEFNKNFFKINSAGGEWLKKDLYNENSASLALSYGASSLSIKTQDGICRINERFFYFWERYLNYGGKTDISSIKKSLKENPFSKDYDEFFLKSYPVYAFEYFSRKGNYKEAESLLSKSKFSKNNGCFIKILASDAARKKDCNKMENLKESFEKNNMADWFYAYSSAAGCGEFEKKMLKEAKQERKSDPKKDSQAKSFSDKAVSLIKENKYQEAEKELEKALALNPYHFESVMNMSYLLSVQGRYEEAKVFLDAVLEDEKELKSENLCSAYMTRSWVLSKMNLLKESQSDKIKAEQVCRKKDKEDSERQ
ncbi:MAG: tetratricopeptide repeat protein [Elusimicrobia bacterium]|nr:tetratricopeptide repeat protein [Elusimicrobiota bacterium]